MKVTLENGKLCLDMRHLWEMVYNSIADEFDQDEFIERMAWTDQIKEKFLKIMEDEYAGTCINTDVHKARQKLLRAINKREIEYYASEIGRMVEELRRDNNDYWTLYHYVSSRFEGQWRNIPKKTRYNFEYTKKIAEIVQDALMKKFDLEEVVEDEQK